MKNNLHIFLKWYIAINKRLLKRFEFIAMLLVLPLLVIGLMWVSKKEKGLLNIGIVVESFADNDVDEVVDKLTEQKSVINFHKYSEEDEAVQQLKKDKLDVIWCLPNSFNNIQKGSIRIIQRDNNAIKNLSREKLYSLIYPYIAHSMYIEYMNKINVFDIEELDEYFNRIKIDKDFIEFEGVEGESPYDKLDYLTYPVRGFMCIWLFVGVMMSNIYFISDNKKGLFAMMDRWQKRLIVPVYTVGISLNLSLIMLITLIFTGQAGDILKEIISMLLLLISLILFAGIIKSIFIKAELLEALMLPVILFLIILSPIIFDIRMFGITLLPRLNPIYYYLNVVADSGYLASFGIFIVLMLLINIIIGSLNRILR